MPLIWTALATLQDLTIAERLGEALEALEPVGVGVCEVDEAAQLFEVGGYFTHAPDDTALALLSAAFGASDFVVSEVDDRDWVAQVRRELTPIEIAPFFIYGAHDAHRLPPGALGLRIEAAMAFGTGHHGTTQGCLKAMAELARRGFKPRNALDLGCGAGILAMGAAKLWRIPVIASDIDPIATLTTQENARINGLAPFIRPLCAVGLNAPPLRAAAPYDLVLANILAGPLKRLAPQICAHTAPGGRIILSGLLRRHAPGVQAVFKGWGADLEARYDLGAWSSLALKRRGKESQRKFLS